MKLNNIEYSDIVLEKQDIMQNLARFLSTQNKTSLNELRDTILEPLRLNGDIGNKSKSIGGGIHTFTVHLKDEYYLLINECIYDLLYNRVITPGVDVSNLEWPHLHVSDQEKLKSYL